jgi:hypothetical protein
MRVSLEPLVMGNPPLQRTSIVVSPPKTPNVNTAGALAFQGFLLWPSIA